MSGSIPYRLHLIVWSRTAQDNFLVLFRTGDKFLLEKLDGRHKIFFGRPKYRSIYFVFNSFETVVYLEGRTFPINVRYALEDYDDYTGAAISTVLSLHSRLPLIEHFLVFLTGQDEIDAACKILKEQLSQDEKIKKTQKMEILPLYAALSQSQQLKVFKPAKGSFIFSIIRKLFSIFGNLYRWRIKIFSGTNETAFYIGVLPILEHSYLLELKFRHPINQ